MSKPSTGPDASLVVVDVAPTSEAASRHLPMTLEISHLFGVLLVSLVEHRWVHWRTPVDPVFSRTHRDSGNKSRHFCMA